MADNFADVIKLVDVDIFAAIVEWEINFIFIIMDKRLVLIMDISKAQFIANLKAIIIYQNIHTQFYLYELAF